MLPFTWEAITYEGWYQLNYDTPITGPLFPGNSIFNSYFVIGFPGACDIGIIPG